MSLYLDTSLGNDFFEKLSSHVHRPMEFYPKGDYFRPHSLYLLDRKNFENHDILSLPEETLIVLISNNEDLFANNFELPMGPVLQIERENIDELALLIESFYLMQVERLKQIGRANVKKVPRTFSSDTLSEFVYDLSIISLSLQFIGNEKINLSLPHYDLTIWERDLHDLDNIDFDSTFFQIHDRSYTIKFENVQIDNDHLEYLYCFIFHLLSEQSAITRSGDQPSNDNAQLILESDIPIAYLSENSELLWQNIEFSKLRILPQKLATYTNDLAIETEVGPYLVKKVTLPYASREASLYYFLAPKLGGHQNIEQISQTELGIVTSSIAHELNNPIGGILAVIGLLELEDGLGDELKGNFEEIKKSSLRAKELIDVFLGFSRFTPHLQKRVTIQSAIHQALNLLRFRMVESNFRIDLKNREDVSNSLMVEESTTAMIFYLVLSSILTLSMREIVLRENNSERGIRGEVEYQQNRVDFFFMNGPNLKNLQLKNLKLLSHLLARLNLSLHLEENSISFLIKGES